MMQDSNATPSIHPLHIAKVGKTTKAVSGKRTSYIQKSPVNVSELSIFTDTECKGEPLRVRLESSRDWTSSCYTVGLAWNGKSASLIQVKSDRQLGANGTVSSSQDSEDLRLSLEASFGSHFEKAAQAEAKITC